MLLVFHMCVLEFRSRFDLFKIPLFNNRCIPKNELITIATMKAMNISCAELRDEASEGTRGRGQIRTDSICILARTRARTSVWVRLCMWVRFTYLFRHNEFHAWSAANHAKVITGTQITGRVRATCRSGKIDRQQRALVFINLVCKNV